MFKPKSKKEVEGLDKAIDNVLVEMDGFTSDTEEYAKMVDQLEKLYKIKAATKANRVSPETIATIAGNLIGIGMILSYERVHVVTSKALSFVMKTKV